MTGQSHRRLAAGEAERGGGAQDRRSGDHSGGGDHPREARAHAHPVEHAEGCGAAELAGAELWAAAGVRQLVAAALWCTAVETEGSYGLLAPPGTRGRARKGPAWARATVAPWPAARGLRARWRAS